MARSNHPLRPLPPAGVGRRRDPITRAAFMCELMALGLVAASFYLKFSNALQPLEGSPVSVDNFSNDFQRTLFVAVHTRTPWVVMAIVSLLVAISWYRTRKNPKRSRIVAFAPLAVVGILALHAIAQAILTSRGPLTVESHTAKGIGRMTVLEGTHAQWQSLIAGDMLFAAPIFMAFGLSLLLPRMLRTERPTQAQAD